MSIPRVQDLQLGEEVVISRAADEYLAFVDLESYVSEVGPGADRLDMMVHLQSQMEALRAFAWDVPLRALSLRLIVTGDHQAMERVTFANRPPTASGTVRTDGELCLAGREILVACAREAGRRFGDEEGTEGNRAQIFRVPAGIYYILAYYRLAHAEGQQAGHGMGDEVRHDFTVFLHHYPHPPPRVAPVRLSAGLIPWAGESGPEFGQR